MRGGGERLPVRPEVQARLLEAARAFRKEPTRSEQLLWQALRNNRLGMRFRRQQPIGPFIVDFFCAAARLIVEVDGGIHAEQQERDLERQHLLEAAGYRVLRIHADAVESDLGSALAIIRQQLTHTEPQ